MTSRRLKGVLQILILLALTSMLAVAVTSFAFAQAPEKAEASEAAELYIIQFKSEPLAKYQGGIAGLPATSIEATGDAHLDVSSSAAQAYRSYLAREQASAVAAMESRLGRSVDLLYSYDVVLNGVGTSLTAAEARLVEGLPQVAQVIKSEMHQLQTDTTPDFIGATSIWSGTSAYTATKGEGVIVGVVDSGIWPENPSFADDGSFPAPPAKWQGGCVQPMDNTAPYTCTNKLIGVKYFLTGYISAVGVYDGLFISGRDDDGHGSHTAGTAAGNENVAATVVGLDRGLISGIAPRAHVASYKGCGPLGCTTLDLVGAINEAVADGVDVINYSIGGGASDPWTDADSLAFLAAAEAGVFAATSAGNSGPGPATVGSPANAPWLMAVGANTSNRSLLSDIELSGPGTPPTGLYGVSLTDGVQNFRLVDAEGIPDSTGDTSGLCLNPFSPGTFESTDVVLCARGAIARVLRGPYVQAGGAGGVILYNPTPNSTNLDLYPIPAVHVQDDIGLQIKNYLTSTVGMGTAQFMMTDTVRVTFTAGTPTFSDDPRVVDSAMAGFSSRGGFLNEDWLSPDITGPGVNVLAAASPEIAPGSVLSPLDEGQDFKYLGGTSMSSPHLAGAGALMKALYPDWTPDQIRSALMTTSRTDVVKEDNTTPATPHDMGAGHVDLTKAAMAGFVLDESGDDYRAANPAAGGVPANMNLASLSNANCVGVCSWTREIMSTKDMTVTWTVSSSGSPSMTLTASPSSFELAPGAMQTIVFTANVTAAPVDNWVYSQVNFTPDDSSVPMGHFPVAVYPRQSNLPPTFGIRTSLEEGARMIDDVQFAGNISALNVSTYGTMPAEKFNFKLNSDPTNSNPFDNLGDPRYGTYVIQKSIMTDTTKRLVAEVLDTTAQDIDLFVARNGSVICQSAAGGSDEKCDLMAEPGSYLAPGSYLIIVQNWAGSQGIVGTGSLDLFDDVSVAVGVVDAMDSTWFDVTGPESVPAGQMFDLTVNFTVTRTMTDTHWYGFFEVGSDSSTMTDVGATGLDFVLLPSNNINTLRDSGLETLATTLEQAGLLDAVNALTQATIFAPSNDAFAALGSGRAASAPTLQEILLYHVVNGVVITSGQVTTNTSLTTLEGSKLAVGPDGNGGVTVGGASVIQPDVSAPGGVVHVIDRVLNPPQPIYLPVLVKDSPGTLAEEATRAGFSALVGALQATGLDTILADANDGPFTVFAPTNAAFNAISTTVATLSVTQTTNVLLYHVVQGEVPAATVVANSPLVAQSLFAGHAFTATATTSGTLTTVTLTDEQGNMANVVMTDVQASNGIIHVIDKVILPSSLD